ncbi:hypothetical protein PR048_025409 [Dryococelus australis]|uniref:Uncharacterized protein n=1 Tax=Dryococelus australis TaxID=614101 RepID=A0ABQ9GR75_9NEOP|nr:hypothetical protein PR048_025409 [Dryococelus australis]
MLPDVFPVQRLKRRHLTWNNLATKRDEEFTLQGFKNWKKAMEKFTTHAGTSRESHLKSEENWMELLKLRSLNVPYMSNWLQQDLYTLCDKIKYIDFLIFSVICDGTQDYQVLNKKVFLCGGWMNILRHKKVLWSFTRHHQQLVKPFHVLYVMF